MRRQIFTVIGFVSVILFVLLGQASPIHAGLNNLRLSNTSCSGVTATVYFDGNQVAPLPNSLTLAAYVNGAGTPFFVQQALDPAALAGDVTLTLAWPTQPTGTVMGVTVSQHASDNTLLTVLAMINYTCAQPQPDAAAPFIDPGVAREREQGITRLYNDMVQGVVYLMPNGDVQFYRLIGGAGRWIGTVPAAQMNNTLYQPGQHVGQFGSGDGWQAELFFHGWNTWYVLYFDETGAQRAEIGFECGDPHTGLPPSSSPLAPQAGGPGSGSAPVEAAPFVPAFTLTARTYLAVGVYAGPGVTFHRLNIIAAGMPVTVIGRNAVYTWAEVVLPDGSTGWIALNMLTISVNDISPLAVRG